jgi:hypothetical protein
MASDEAQGAVTLMKNAHPVLRRAVVYGGAKGEVVELPIGRVRLTNATLLWQLRIEVFLVREEIVCRYD